MKKDSIESKFSSKSILTSVLLAGLTFGSAGCYESHRRPPRDSPPNYSSNSSRYDAPCNNYSRHPRTHIPGRGYRNGYRIFGNHHYYGNHHSPGLLTPRIPHRRYTHPRIVPPNSTRHRTNRPNHIQRTRRSRERANQTLQRKSQGSRQRGSRQQGRKSRGRISR